MPRVYTIKTILSALDRDLDDLQQDSQFESKVKEAMLFELDDSKDTSFLITQLHIGWIAGILSMIAFIFEFFDDFYYISEGAYYFGKIFTVILGLCSILFFSLFMRSFVLIGNLFKNTFLKIIAILFIVMNAIVASYALFDMDFVLMSETAYGVMYTVFFGVMTLFFGYALFKLKGLGQLPQVSGILHMVLGAMMLTIFLAIVAGPASILAQALNVAIILKTYEVIKRQIST